LAAAEDAQAPAPARKVPGMNPIRRTLEAVGLKPKTRKKRLPLLSSAAARIRRSR